MTRIFLILSVLFVTACTQRAELVVSTDVVGQIQEVFVSTSREGTDKLVFSDKRSATQAYARYRIAVPPERVPGEINAPTGSKIDPQKQFLVDGVDVFPDSAAFRHGIRDALRERAPKDREVTIYVHGFNNNFADGVLRITQLAHDFEIPGVAVHYAWPSAGHPLAYAYDRDSALFARDGLEQLIYEVREAGAESVVLIAHSVGSLLVMESLRSMSIAKPGSVAKEINGVILISPDLDIDVFRSQATRIGQLPEPFGIFVSKRDRVLSLSARLTGTRNRLGNVDSVDQVADLDVTVIDVTDFSSGAGHFTAGSSPGVIQIFAGAGNIEDAFNGDRAGRSGLFSGAVLTVQNATAILLSPVTGGPL